VKFVLAAVLGALAMAYRSLGSVFLEGSSWDVRVRARSLFAFPRKDTLVFERGRFISSTYLSSGYLPGGYSAEDGLGKTSRFSASLIREDGSSVDWVGEITGDKMKGTVVWQKRNGARRRYSFKGRRQPGPSVSTLRSRAARWAAVVRAPFARGRR